MASDRIDIDAIAARAAMRPGYFLPYADVNSMIEEVLRLRSILLKLLDKPDEATAEAFLADIRDTVHEVDRLRAENAALRGLVARFYTQAWEDPLTDEEMALLDPIVNEADRG